jgi:hypothetical protein
MQKILHERMPEKSISIQLDPGTLQCSGKIRAAEEDCTSKEIVFGFIEWLPEW